MKLKGLKMEKTSNKAEKNIASLKRRLAAIFYDSLLLISIFFITTMLANPLIASITNSKDFLSSPLYIPLVRATYFIISFLFFVSFWSKRGQTLGLVCWKLKLVNEENNLSPNKKVCSLRFFIAFLTIGCFGIGLLWALVDKDRQCLYDRLSKTKLVKL